MPSESWCTYWSLVDETFSDFNVVLGFGACSFVGSENFIFRAEEGENVFILIFCKRRENPKQYQHYHHHEKLKFYNTPADGCSSETYSDPINMNSNEIHFNIILPCMPRSSE